MTSIYRTAKKRAVQRNQYVNPWDGLVYSRAASAPRRNDYTVAELREDKLIEAAQARKHREHDQLSRKTERPVYGKASLRGSPRECYWVARKTPDRSIRHRKQINYVAYWGGAIRFIGPHNNKLEQTA